MAWLCMATLAGATRPDGCRDLTRFDLGNLALADGSYLPALLFHGVANICAYVFELSERADARASALWIAAGAIAAIDMRLFRSAPRTAEHTRESG